MVTRGNNTMLEKQSRINYLLQIINVADNPTIDSVVGQMAYYKGVTKAKVLDYLDTLISVGKIEIFDGKITSLCKPKKIDTKKDIKEALKK